MANPSSSDTEGQKLTYGLGMGICKRMFPICDCQSKLVAKLQAEGFSAFMSRHEFEVSFCNCVDSERVHQRIAVEEAKVQLSAPTLYLPASLGEMKRLYASPFIEELKLRRDEANGCKETEIQHHFLLEDRWVRWQYDPCLRRAAILQRDSKAEYNERKQSAEDEQWSRFEREVEIHTSGMGNGREVSREDRCVFVTDVAHKYGEKLGFTFSRAKSPVRKPTVWKSLTKNWDLRWTVAETDSFVFAPFVQRKDRLAQSDLDAKLILCANHLKSDVEKSGKPGEYFELAYRVFVPEFTHGYRKFYDYDELELIIKAHFTLLSLVLPEMENAVVEILQEFRVS